MRTRSPARRCNPLARLFHTPSEQTDEIRFEGDVFAFTLSTQYARKVYRYADALRADGKKVILGGIHPTVCPEEAMRHADAIVTGEAELLWPTVCDDLLGGRLQARYDGSPTPPSRMRPVDYRFFGRRRYLTPASTGSRTTPARCARCGTASRRATASWSGVKRWGFSPKASSTTINQHCASLPQGPAIPQPSQACRAERRYTVRFIHSACDSAFQSQASAFTSPQMSC
ncbi:MAG TPA: cobalamin-dependent protein [Verrucomicrobiota bacterium]|nr:cobalamin-dependent protein [Verrucomicrobiota bacterium]OQC66640.1 MAG: B12 binding domain protein [Verrucomicrobia bacterium ADurb.Bin006]HOA60953.1 cobalamin-dependent protein [Verrucomicrobiota bacterium]HOF48583.1 cobalamin-dependent protein [Verrucomicrobiota bacterium]HOG86900.1 cobalamin-dependent protein [Verrucomicrobiota bacterium]